MASPPPNFGRASALPLSAVLDAIHAYPRPVIERLVACLVEHLDEQDGDPDVELNGDELDGTNAEDELCTPLCGPNMGPGCAISDPDCGIDDFPHDDFGDAEPEEGVAGNYGVDQRVAPTWHGAEPL